MTPAKDDANALLRDHGIDGCEPALGAYIAHQRWAGAHGRTIERTEIVDAAVIRPAAPLLVHTLTAVTYTDGVTTRYALPLCVRDVGDPLAERAPDYVIAWPDAPRALLLLDAIGDPMYIEWLLELDSHAARARDDEWRDPLLVPRCVSTRHGQPQLGASPACRAEQHVGRGRGCTLSQAHATS